MEIFILSSPLVLDIPVISLFFNSTLAISLRVIIEPVLRVIGISLISSIELNSPITLMVRSCSPFSTTPPGRLVLAALSS